MLRVFLVIEGIKFYLENQGRSSLLVLSRWVGQIQLGTDPR